MIHTKKQKQSVIDGERKAVLQRIDVGNFSYTGLVARSEWGSMKAKAGVSLVTQRTLLGATLHIPECKGQFPEIGTIIPVNLLKGRTQVRTGKAMDLHLKAIVAAKKANKVDAGKYRAIKASIVA